MCRTNLRHAARNVARGEHGRAEAAQPATADETASTEDPATAETPETAEAPKSEPPPTSAEGAPAVVSRAASESAPTPNVDAVLDAVRRCFRERTVTNGDLHVTVNTQMSLRIQASGRVGEAVFTPPLAPSVRRCVDDSVGAMHFPSSPNGFAVEKVLDLER